MVLKQSARIEIETVLNSVRITVPKGVRAARYFRRVFLIKLATMIVFALGSVAAGATHMNDIGWDIMWGIFAVTFGGAAFYAIRFPERVQPYIPDTSLISLDDGNLTVKELERERVWHFAGNEITAVKATRCDFSRRAQLIIRVRKERRRFAAIIATYDELQALSEVAEVLRSGLSLSR
jgi:hypothetical protein